MKKVPQVISDKDITQIKDLKSAGYVHTKDQDQIK